MRRRRSSSDAALAKLLVGIVFAIFTCLGALALWVVRLTARALRERRARRELRMNGQADPIYKAPSKGLPGNYTLTHTGPYQRAGMTAATASQPHPTTGSHSVRANADEPFVTVTMELGKRFSSYPGVEIPPAPVEMRNVRWLSPKETIQPAGFTITGGLLYYGTGPRPDHLSDASLINPRLKVSPSPVLPGSMGYWPSYGSITPAERARYLQWLADGRKSPNIDIGYVFLYFYGLERRLLVDAKAGQVGRDELGMLIAEIERLRCVYGANGSFNRYSGTFLEYLRAAYPEVAPDLKESSPSMLWAGYQMPFSLRLQLGTLAQAQQPISSQVAYGWVLNDPLIIKRTAIVRCLSELPTIFQAEYEKLYGSGLVLEQNKTKLQFSYTPASPSLRGSTFNLKTNLPDIAAVTTPQKKLQVVVDHCAQVLDSYSRYLGRNPGSERSMEALLLLPWECWPSERREAFERVIEMVGTNQSQSMTWAELQNGLGIETNGGKNTSIAIAYFLEGRGVGIEPDILAGVRQLKPDDMVVLFPCTASDATARSKADYKLATLIIALAASVALADGVASEFEEEAAHAQIRSWTHLSAVERDRLKAHYTLQLLQPTAVSNVKGRFATLEEEAKRQIANVLAIMAQADGTLAPEEVKLLERLYRALGLDPQTVYTDLHQKDGAPRSSMSKTPGGTRPGFTLDHDRIAALQVETQKISSVLAEVFAEDDQEPAVHVDLTDEHPTEEEAPVLVLGLDTEHAAFLHLLLSRSLWSRTDLMDSASDMKLMLDGALERINEAALDAIGMPIAEGDDPIEVNTHALEMTTV